MCNNSYLHGLVCEVTQHCIRNGVTIKGARATAKLIQNHHRVARGMAKNRRRLSLEKQPIKTVRNTERRQFYKSYEFTHKRGLTGNDVI